MTAEKIARFLSSLTAPDSKYDIAEQQIKSLVRPAGQKIKTIMAHLKALAETLYDKVTDAERTVLTDRLLATGILNMTTGQTRTDIKAAIEYAKRENCTLDWDKMIEAVSRSESVLGMPQTALPFSGAIQPSILTFNVDTRTPGMYHNGVDPLIRQDLDMSWPQTDNATRDWYNPHLNAPPPHMHVNAPQQQMHENAPPPHIQQQQIAYMPANNVPVNPLAQNAPNPAAAGAIAQQANNPFEGLMQPANAALNAPAPQRNRAASLGLEENFMRQAQQVSGLRSGSQRNHPDHAPNQVNHADIVDVLVAKIQNGAKELAYQAIRKELERKRSESADRDKNKDKSRNNSRERTTRDRNSSKDRPNSRDRGYNNNRSDSYRDNRSDSRERTYRDTRYNSQTETTETIGTTASIGTLETPETDNLTETIGPTAETVALTETTTTQTGTTVGTTLMTGTQGTGLTTEETTETRPAAETETEGPDPPETPVETDDLTAGQTDRYRKDLTVVQTMTR
jgi:hypothetical protein